MILKQAAPVNQFVGALGVFSRPYKWCLFIGVAQYVAVGRFYIKVSLQMDVEYLK
jgi:hypothetical protein